MFVIIGSVLSLILVIFFFIRAGPVKEWTHRDVLAFIALIATIAGAIVLLILNNAQNSVFVRQADRLINELVRDPNVRKEVGDVLLEIVSSQTEIQYAQSIGIIIVLLSLGLVISARTFKANLPGGSGFEFGTMIDGDGKAVPVMIPKATAAPAVAPPAPVDDKTGELREQDKIK